jgi:tripartite-type tricarboxylate transporter receptor subunit TctC
VPFRVDRTKTFWEDDVKILRRRFSALLVPALLLFGMVAAPAQTYPSKPITILCGQPPGSGPDVMARLYGDVISRSFGQRIVVDNRVGAGGVVAAQTLTQSAPDGYTLLLVLGGMHTIVPAMQSLAFDPLKDFEFITLLYESNGLLLVPASSPAKSVSDVIAASKAKPGGASFGSPGVGSPAHLMGALLSEKAGSPMTHVAYRGGGPLFTDLLAGRLDFAFISPVQAKPQVEAGAVRALAVAGDRRIKWLPDVPTLGEAGFGEVAVPSWFGIAAPKGTPKAIVDRIHQEFLKASQDPLVIKRADEESVAILTGPTEEITKILAYDYERLGRVVKAFGIKAE